MVASGSPMDGFRRDPSQHQQRQDWRLLMVLVGIILTGLAVTGVAYGLT